MKRSLYVPLYKDLFYFGVPMKKHLFICIICVIFLNQMKAHAFDCYTSRNISTLINCLKAYDLYDEGAVKRAEAASINLVKIGQKAVPPLIRLSDETDSWAIKFGINNIYKEMGKSALFAIPQLISHYENDDNFIVRSSAALALGTVTPKNETVAELFLKGLANDYALDSFSHLWLKARIVEAFGNLELTDEKIIDALIFEVKNEFTLSIISPEVRLQAILALGKLGLLIDFKERPQLYTLLKNTFIDVVNSEREVLEVKKAAWKAKKMLSMP